MNASETLLREILREMQKQTEILERIDRNLPQTDDLDPSGAERRKNFRQDLDQLRETLQNRSRNSGLRASPQKTRILKRFQFPPEKHHPIQ
ncbi:MAG: hypothetical protein Ct9H90mP9_2590 [Pseudomonadota bacterium]|nr:MAG: hypothetical protein Ct9H90mP9_2590 [Pseudomonadota bacterium]